MATSSPSSKEQKGCILPGLSNDVAVRCLAFVPRTQHARLRCVSTQWRDLFKQGLSSLHALRCSLGLTQSYLLLIPREYYRTPDKTLRFSEIHLHPSTHAPTIRKGSLHTPLRAQELPSLRGHACISMGPFVLILGGAHMGPKPLSELHIFDTTSAAWWHGASMQSPRSDFAWGVIENRLYVAGGFLDENVGYIQQAEVYDFDADRWSRLTDMPISIVIDLFFVHKGALYVRGCTVEYALKLFSYHPSLNEWKEEEWMLGNVLNNVKPLTTNKITALQDKEDDTLYMLDIQGERRVNYHQLLARLKVLKLAPNALEWETEFEVLDVVRMSLECPCSEAIYRDPSFPSIGKKVLIMDHLESSDFDENNNDDDINDNDDDDNNNDDDDVNVQITEASAVLILSLPCPSRVDVVVLNA